ncbi:OmpA family protein [uncultured Devosia sp.]|uniref:OmpA family protein n=1 Tax=uncultured Devosia sp. TaxID=211434 RepID=UPI0035CA4B28
MGGRPLALGLLASCLLVSSALAEDVAGSADHPLTGRFEGASIIFYKAAALDRAALLQGPHDYNALLERNALTDRTGPEWLPLEGKVTRIRYDIPAGHSSYEVSRSYESALMAKGFSVIYSCADAACLTGMLTDDYLIGQQVDTDNSDTARYSTNLHYLLAVHDPAGGMMMQGDGALPDPATEAPFGLPEPIFDASAGAMPEAMGGPGSAVSGGPGSEATAAGGPGFATPEGPGSEATSGMLMPGAPGLSAPGFDTTGGPGSETGNPLLLPGTPDPAGPATAIPDAAGQPTYVAILVGEDGALTTAFIEVVEPAGGSADAAGQISVEDATQMAAAFDAGQSINIYGLHFDTDSAVLQPDSQPTLDQIVQLLDSQPQLRLAVIGHTDDQGSASYNLALSTRRAQSVVAALIEQYGIASDRLSPSGQGLSQPIAPNDTADGRAQNRRVELSAE